MTLLTAVLVYSSCFFFVSCSESNGESLVLHSQVFLCVGEGCTNNDTNILHYNHIALALLTGFLFATHLPERLAPGSFDYIGENGLRVVLISILSSKSLRMITMVCCSTTEGLNASFVFFA